MKEYYENDTVVRKDYFDEDKTGKWGNSVIRVEHFANGKLVKTENMED